MFIYHQPARQFLYMLNSNCSNNQAKQFAILQGLQQLNNLSIEVDHKSAAFHIDSTITLDLLQNPNKHDTLIEDIRNTIRHLETDNWNLHLGESPRADYGNEMADRLAKSAARNPNTDISFGLILKSPVKRVLCEKSLETWQLQCGAITRSFFPKLKLLINYS